MLPAAFYPLSVLLIWVIFASGWTYFVFALDKRRAIAGEWRIPEKTLLWLALLGGAPGARLAQKRLRHKSSKPSFRRALNRVIAVQVVFGVLVLGAPLAGRFAPLLPDGPFLPDLTWFTAPPTGMPRELPRVNRGITRP